MRRDLNHARGLWAELREALRDLPITDAAKLAASITIEVDRMFPLKRDDTTKERR